MKLSTRLLKLCAHAGARSFHDRVAVLVLDEFDGNVSRASKALGIPRNTLHQVYRGFVQSPSAKVYVALSNYSGRSIDWWITGK